MFRTLVFAGLLVLIFSSVATAAAVAAEAAAASGSDLPCAEQEQAPAAPVKEGEKEPRLGEMLALTLEECVFRAYANNIAIQKSRHSAASMATFFEQAQGAFDPAFFVDARGGESVTPSGAQLIGGFGFQEDFDQDSFNLNTGFRGLLLSGATYEVDLALGRTYVDPPTSLLNPQVVNNTGVQISQPLLRNGWTAYNRAESIKAVLNSRQEDLNLESTLNATIFSTIEAYWNVVYGTKNLETTQKSLELAEELLKINTRKMREGIFTKIEVLEASSTVATRKEQVITARNAVETAEDELRKLIFPFAQSEEWDVAIIPMTQAESGESETRDLESLVKEAVKNRADYRSLVEDQRRLEVELLQARNQKLPKLDLIGDYRLNSIGSNVGNSFNSIVETEYRSFSIALSLEVPIGNRSARSVERRAIIDLRKAQASLVEKKIDIAFEIRESLRNISLQQEKLLAAEESKMLSEERYQGELKRLKAGRSITYLVREAESNFFQESIRVNRALLDYQIALSGLERAKGTLLAQYGFTVGKSIKEDWIFANL